MKWFSNDFFRSFQFRLLAYLIIVGSIPLVLAILVFYQQSTSYAQNEISNIAKQTHEQIVQRVQQEFYNLEMISNNVGSDYLLQQFLITQPSDQEISERNVIIHLNEIRDAQKSSFGLITDVCVFVDNESNTSNCRSNDVRPEGIESIPQNKAEKLYRFATISPNIGENKTQKGLMLISPLFEQKSKEIKGQVVVILNLGKLINQITLNNRSILQYTILDVRMDSTAKEIKSSSSKEDSLISVLPIDGIGAKWISKLEIKNDYMKTTWLSLRNTMIVLFAILLFLSLLSSVVFSRLIIKPLNHLQKLMKRAEVGDLKAYWMSNSTKEINDLGESYNHMLFNFEELFKQVKLEESLKKEAEIQALQLQLNPHFLYNTLNTIKWVAKIHKTPQISEVVSALVRLLQASLGKRGDFITIKEEVLLIQDYMEIQSFRYGEQVKLHFEIDPLASLCLVPRMIMQPLVENALIHGIEPSNREGIIIIRAMLDRDLLLCEVEDNGKGMAESQPVVKEKMSGIGMQHIREKIKLYYGPDYKMHIFSRENEGTVVRLSLPIHRGEE